MPQTDRPNVILVMTDDQGYGDLGCTGNPWIQTPHIDRFYSESLRCTDFHVQPLCTPTRGALMTGRRPVRNGAWATCWGRSILKRDETTMADVFGASGYRTGMFGKWHLGDNYPYRPFDRGFEHVVAHKGGGVGQTPDFWGNNYFDDMYVANGQIRQYEGYCTDVWFDQALDFIDAHREEPFLAYIATNAPHSPYLVAERYRRLYADNPDIPEAAFYGMITNIDENFGRLDRALAEGGLQENTILIFMTDNGSSAGSCLDANGFVTQGYNAGMRGKKGSYYEGGHRVPFFVRWPEAGVGGGCDAGAFSCDIDLVPTLSDLCGIQLETNRPVDGRSFAPVLRGEQEDLPDRVHFLQYRQSTTPPEIWTNAVLTARWRLIHGKELYDIREDPGQRTDVAGANPEVVAELRAAHEAWWKEIEPNFERFCPIVLGNDKENPTKLCAMDVMGDVAWNQGAIVAAQKSTGQWNVEVEKPGRYRFRLRRWPEELPIPMDGMVSDEFARTCVYPGAIRKRIAPKRARLSLFGNEHCVDVQPGREGVSVELNLEQTGPTVLEAWFEDASGEERGAYYVYAERVEV